MTDDIVTRLRNQFSNEFVIEHLHMVRVPTLYEEAADEIERLRTIIRDYYLTEKEYESCRDQNDIVYLEDEWKAAWKALEVEALRRDTW